MRLPASWKLTGEKGQSKRLLHGTSIRQRVFVGLAWNPLGRDLAFVDSTRRWETYLNPHRSLCRT